MKIIFVCTGSTCRSPMAEVMMKNILKREGINIEVISRGIAVRLRGKANINSIKVMEEMGLDLTNHLSTQIGPHDIEDGDLILTMTKNHSEYVRFLTKGKGRVYTLKEYVGENKIDVADPYGGSINQYRTCALEIKELLERAVEKLKIELKG